MKSFNQTYIAALIMGATVFLHLFGGGPQYHDAFLVSLSDSELKSMASILWHAVTIMLAVFTFSLIYLARHKNIALELTLAAIQVCFSLAFLWYGWKDLGTIWPMPQWVIFLSIVVLTFFGQRRKVT